MSPKTAIVVGAGFGGIAAALRLRARGYHVNIIDRAQRLGGRAQVFVRDGFRHDAGPTVITAPFLFDELFELFGRRRDEYVNFVPLDPWYRFVYPDGDTFDYGGSVESTLSEIERLSPADVNGYRSLVAKSEAIYDLGFEQLADQPFHKLSSMLRLLPQLVRLRADRSVWQLVSRHIRDDRIRQAFSIQPLLVGGNPFDTTSIYNLIHFLERRWGIHFAMGGTGAIVDALERLMHEVGIRIALETTVTQIIVENGRATGIRLANGRTMKADLVVSNADPAHVYDHMLGRRYQTPQVRLKRRAAKFSMGMFVLYFGTRRQYHDVAHHTIWLGQRYRELLRDIFDRKILADDFSLYLHRPTATDPSFAPAGKDSFYVLAPVPNLEGNVDWSVEGPRLRQRIVDALDRTILPGLNQSIQADFFMTPEDFRDDYLSVAGAGFSIAPLLRQSAWFRFHNRAEGPDNFYLVGAGTHPGAGLPGVLSSAKVLDHLVPRVGNAPMALERVRMTSTDHNGVTGSATTAQATLARHGKSFALANRFFDKGTAERCARLYAFCRYVDDVADDRTASTTAARQHLREMVQMLLLHAPPNEAVADFLELCREVDMPVDPAIELVRGVASDLGEVRVDSIGALHRYCYRVAGTVGILMCGVLGVRDPRALPFAIDLGIAMQLTNIARDVREDAEAGRRYIPESIIGNLSPDAILRADATTKPLIAWSVGWLLDEADRFYKSGEEGLAYLPPRAKLAIRVAGRVYRQIGVRIRRSGFTVWRGRTTISRVEKLATAGSALLSHLGKPLVVGARPRHSAALHSCLGTLAGTHHSPLTQN